MFRGLPGNDLQEDFSHNGKKLPNLKKNSYNSYNKVINSNVFTSKLCKKHAS